MAPCKELGTLCLECLPPRAYDLSRLRCMRGRKNPPNSGKNTHSRKVLLPRTWGEPLVRGIRRGDLCTHGTGAASVLSSL